MSKEKMEGDRGLILAGGVLIERSIENWIAGEFGS